MAANSHQNPRGIRRRELLGLLASAPVMRLLGQTRTITMAGRGPALTQKILYYGGGSPPAQQMALEAGPLTMIFEPDLAFLRFVRFGDTEVLRGLYAAVRDHNWGTVAPQVSGLRLEKSADGFRLRFSVLCKEGPIDFRWDGELTGDSKGTVAFAFDGTSASDFLRNRIGFCVLHGPGLAGQPVEVQTVDGSTQTGAFPDEISPHQPFMNLRALTHNVTPQVKAEVRMEGDTFEMEDQRNWTDGSYKTYCTPLGDPFPAPVKTGTKVRQNVTLRLEGPALLKAPGPGGADSGAITLTAAGDQTFPLPRLGLGVSSVAATLELRATAFLKALRLSHLRVDLTLFESGWDRRLKQAVEQSRAIGADLELAIHLGAAPEEELKGLAAQIREIRPQVLHYAVFHRDEKSTTKPWMEMARKHIGAVDAAAKLASGTNAYFTELNRGRPPLDVSDLVTYSINPQVHAFDLLSLVETLEMQAVTLDSARKFCGKLPLVVSPVTLRPRFNPNATAAAAPPRPSGPFTDLPEEVDARQPSLFTAGWTLGSLKYLAEGGASMATYYETVGWRGVMEREQGSLLPSKFPSRAGNVFPIYHVLAAVAPFAGGEVDRIASSRKFEVEGMLLRNGARRRLLVANLTNQARVVRVQGAGLGSAVRVKMLNEHSAPQAMESPEDWLAAKGAVMEAPGDVLSLALLPYAIAQADSGRDLAQL